MAFTKAYLLPFLVNITFGGTFLTTYAIAVRLGHVNAFLPYISDTGSNPPESTIFGQFLNLGCILAYMTMYARYLQLNTTYLKDYNLSHYQTIKSLNRIAIWLAPIICLGASMAANFQANKAIIPHLIGAFLCGAVGMIYFCIHTYISYKVYPILNSLLMAHFRLFLTITGIISSSITTLFGIVSIFLFTRPLKHIPQWNPDDGGYKYHLVSTFSEWTVALVFGIYYSTFSNEFKDIIIRYPAAEVISRCSPNQQNSYNSNTMESSYETNENNYRKHAGKQENENFVNSLEKYENYRKETNENWLLKIIYNRKNNAKIGPNSNKHDVLQMENHNNTTKISNEGTSTMDSGKMQSPSKNLSRINVQENAIKGEYSREKKDNDEDFNDMEVIENLSNEELHRLVLIEQLNLCRLQIDYYRFLKNKNETM